MKTETLTEALSSLKNLDLSLPAGPWNMDGSGDSTSFALFGLDGNKLLDSFNKSMMTDLIYLRNALLDTMKNITDFKNCSDDQLDSFKSFIDSIVIFDKSLPLAPWGEYTTRDDPSGKYEICDWNGKPLAFGIFDEKLVCGLCDFRSTIHKLALELQIEWHKRQADKHTRALSYYLDFEELPF